MSHKADPSFFDKKKPWSKRKDLILSYYLKPYLPKVATQRRPILIVDGFAGPGQFLDGDPGSPLIIREIVSGFARTLPVAVSTLCVEQNGGLYQQLQARMCDFAGCELRNSTFLECVSEIESAARTHSVFLFLDPYTVEGLRWEALDRIFAALERRVSIEMLLNFNVVSFVRRGLSLLSLHREDLAVVDEDLPDPSSPSSVASLNEIVGGHWWQDVLRNAVSFADCLNGILDGLCERLRKRFNEVCFYVVREQLHHQAPKYVLVFASRHPEALRLMNDAVCCAKELEAEEARGGELALFEMLPEAVVSDLGKLRPLVLEFATKRQQRKSLIAAVMRHAFGQYTNSEIRSEIETLLKQKKLCSGTGKTRINDDVEVWRV